MVAGLVDTHEVPTLFQRDGNKLIKERSPEFVAKAGEEKILCHGES